jgi:cbb3-type cytochrome oxidase subunit 1
MNPEPVAELVVEPVAAPVAAEPVAAQTEVNPLPAGPFHSLYQTFGGTLTAVSLGVLIIVGIQFVVGRIFNNSRTMSDSLTTFATAMVAILVGIYVCDLLIAGPEIMLLREGERTTIVTFIKDISLMCFSYYFGSKTNKEPAT